MERVTKERLTGGLIFCLVLVVVAPELLPGRGGSVAPDAAVAPEADTGPAMQTWDLAIDPAAAPAISRQKSLQPAAAAIQSPQVASVPPPVTDRPDATPVVSAGARQPAASPPARQPDLQAESVAMPKRQPTAAVPAEGQWWVQLGSFASQDNAQRLVRDLRASGYLLEVSQVRAAGKDLYRVRAGPVGDRAAATALQGRLAAAGHPGSLVAP